MRLTYFKEDIGFICQMNDSTLTTEFNIQASCFIFILSLCPQKIIQNIFLSESFLKLLESLFYSHNSDLITIQNSISACLNFLIDFPQKYSKFCFISKKNFVERFLRNIFYASRHSLFGLFLNFIQVILIL